MIRRNPAFRPVEKFNSTEFVWFIDGRHHCGTRVRPPKGKLVKRRWSKHGGRFGQRIAARLKLWRILDEAPF